MQGEGGGGAQLDRLLVGDRMAIERKGQDSYEADNFSNWLFASNEVVPMLVEDGDSRFSLVRGLATLDDYQPGLGAKLHELVDDAEWIQQVIDYLGGIDLSRYAPGRPFDSGERHQVIANSCGQVETWCHEALPPAGEYATSIVSTRAIAPVPKGPASLRSAYPSGGCGSGFRVGDGAARGE